MICSYIVYVFGVWSKMPVMDGIELAGSVARILPNLPILLMTGYADQREGAKALQALIIDVVPKPFTLVEIRAKVRDALGNEHGTFERLS